MCEQICLSVVKRFTQKHCHQCKIISPKSIETVYHRTCTLLHRFTHITMWKTIQMLYDSQVEQRQQSASTRAKRLQWESNMNKLNMDTLHELALCQHVGGPREIKRGKANNKQRNGQEQRQSTLRPSMVAPLHGQTILMTLSVDSCPRRIG